MMAMMKDTIETLGRMPDESISADMRDRLLDRFRTWKR